VARQPSTITSSARSCTSFLAGSGYLRVGDEYRDVRTGHCVVISPGVIHKVTNIADEPLELLCCCAPPYSDDDTVLTGG